MKYVRNILLTLLVLLVIVFIIQNYSQFSQGFEIRLNLYILELQTQPIAGWVLLLAAFFIGVVAASVGGLMERFRIKGELRRNRKEIARLKAELDSLRNLPITEEPVSASTAPVAGNDRNLSESNNHTMAMPGDGRDSVPK